MNGLDEHHRGQFSERLQSAWREHPRRGSSSARGRDFPGKVPRSSEKQDGSDVGLRVRTFEPSLGSGPSDAISEVCGLGTGMERIILPETLLNIEPQ